MVETSRLILVPLSYRQLESLLHQPARIIEENNIPTAVGLVSSRVEKAILMKLEKMLIAPLDQHQWLTYWLLIIKDIHLGAGLLGFKGVPDENGMVEIGYGIAPTYRSRGYTTEAVKQMIEWAFQSPTCQAITAPGTLKSNIASNRVLKKVGMQLYEETDKTNSWMLRRDIFLQDH